MWAVLKKNNRKKLIKLKIKAYLIKSKIKNEFL